MSGERAGDTAADRLVAATGGTVDFSVPRRSFSPFCSDVGLRFTEEAGIAGLCVRCGGRIVEIASPFLGLRGIALKHKRTALYVRQRYEPGQADFIFCGRNTWLMDTRGLGAVEFAMRKGPGLAEVRRRETARGYLIYEVTAASADGQREVALGVRAVRGRIRAGGDEASGVVRFETEFSGRLLVCFAANVGVEQDEKIEEKLGAAAASFDEAYERTRKWMNEALGEMKWDGQEAEAMLAKTVWLGRGQGEDSG